jgi:threonine dehydrogenase-like Zn-dependent dehydrogenase
VPRGVDWTPIWLREVAVHGSAYYAEERLDGRAIRSIDLAMDLLAGGRIDLAALITHQFDLPRYREAIAVALDKRRTHSVKVVLRPP